MSSATLVPRASQADDALLEVQADTPLDTPELPVATPAPVLSASLKRNWLGGTSALAAAVMVERGTGLLANMLAAHLGGASVFGSYSLAISTANNIGTYAAGGIGATATRFAGKYPHGSTGYGALARALSVVALTSAAVAALALWAGAAPFARLLGKPALAELLRWASLSAAAMVLLECARGFFVGQRRIAALLLLSLLVGAGLLIVLPAAARASAPTHMVVLQAAVCCGAVVACLVLAGPLSLRGKVKEAGLPLGPMLREVWHFGFVQVSGMIAANLAGWWLTTLIARSDTTLAQVGFFAIASQMRNLTGVIPGLLTEGSYSFMAAQQNVAEDATESAPHRVMALSSFASVLLSSAIAAIGIVAAPWLLRLLYGPAYLGAQVALAVALALAVAHMGNAPASARLTVVSIRKTAVINTVWAASVAAAATLLLLHHGAQAWQGLAILLGAHLLSAVLVLRALRRNDALPRGMRLAYFAGSIGATVLAALSLVRVHLPQHAALLTLVMLAFGVGQIAWMIALGRRHRWMPSLAMLAELRTRVFARFSRREAGHV